MKVMKMRNRLVRRIAAALALIVMSAAPAYAAEVIYSFDSDVAVARNRELTVTECAPSIMPSATASFATFRFISAGATATCTR